MTLPWAMLANAAAVLAAAYVPRLLWASLPLVAALLLGALLIHLVDRWRKRGQASTPTPGDQLSHFRQLYDQGLLTPEEFERVRNLLGGQMRKELKLPDLPMADLDEESAGPTAPPHNGPGPETSPRPQEPPETGIRPA